MIGGISLAEAFLISKSPKAEPNLKQLTKYSKTIGIILLIVGIIEVIDIIINFDIIRIVFEIAPITGIIFIVAVLFSIISGLILSGETVYSKLANPDGIKNFIAKLETKKTTIGIISIVSGAYLIIWRVIKFRL